MRKVGSFGMERLGPPGRCRCRRGDDAHARPDPAMLAATARWSCLACGDDDGVLLRAYGLPGAGVLACGSRQCTWSMPSSWPCG